MLSLYVFLLSAIHGVKAAPAKPGPSIHIPTRIITVEDHYVFPSLPSNYPVPSINTLLHDVGSTRLSNLDAGHVQLQIISSLSGIAPTNPSGCMQANNDLADIIKKNPKRYGGFAALPMAYPDQAAAELERAVTKLGLSGAMIDNHLPDGTYYDNNTFWPVFEMAVKLDVPLYIHPAPPSTADKALHYNGNYPAAVAAALGTATFGWHEDTGLHLLRLYAAGLFNTYPTLKLLIGHLGETLPIMLNRVDDPGHQIRTDLAFNDVWKRNIWVTTGGFFHVRDFEMFMKTTTPDRVMYSVDYPFGNASVGYEFLGEVARSGVFASQGDMEGFTHGNAERLLRLKM